MIANEGDLELYSQILPGLYMGGTDEDDVVVRARKRLPTVSDPRPFDAVVSLDAYTLPVGWHVKELRYAFVDGPLNEEQIEHIELVADWAFVEWKAGSKTLIRCQAGLNRSGLVTGLVLLRDGMKVELVIDLIREQRSEYALSNYHFVEYLKKWKGAQEVSHKPSG